MSRRLGRSPDFVLFHEEPHKQLIPHLDGFHVREYSEKATSGERAVPGRIREVCNEELSEAFGRKQSRTDFNPFPTE